MEIKLKSDRVIKVSKFIISDNYDGAIHFGPNDIHSKYIRFALSDIIARDLWESDSTVIIDDWGKELPQYRIVTFLKSDTPVHLPKDDGWSEMMLCWFVDSLEKRVAELLGSIVDDEFWNKKAKDYDWSQI